MGKKSPIAEEREKERERDLALGDKDRHNEKMRRVKTHKEEERKGMEGILCSTKPTPHLFFRERFEQIRELCQHVRVEVQMPGRRLQKHHQVGDAEAIHGEAEIVDEYVVRRHREESRVRTPVRK